MDVVRCLIYFIIYYIVYKFIQILIVYKFFGNYRYKIFIYNSMYIVKCIDFGNKKLIRKGLVEFMDF